MSSEPLIRGCNSKQAIDLIFESKSHSRPTEKCVLCRDTAIPHFPGWLWRWAQLIATCLQCCLLASSSANQDKSSLKLTTAGRLLPDKCRATPLLKEACLNDATAGTRPTRVATSSSTSSK